MAKGVDEDIQVIVHEQFPLLTSFGLSDHYTVKEALLELYEEEKISETEKEKFQMLLGDSFSTSWNGTHIFQDREVFGIGKAKEEQGYVVSFNTHFKESDYDWSHSQYRIQRTHPNEAYDFERNIASSKHVFLKYQIWKQNSTKSKPKHSNLLPNKASSDHIPEAYGFSNWKGFYSKIQSVNKSTIKQISKIVAIVNGWKESKDCPGQPRLLFQSKKLYLATDTQHATFEVYFGKRDHRGEIFYHEDIINEDKRDPQRGICGKKGKK
ncbi:hypothetical protein K4L44_10770 [Halosquirtibacter laminarini]|uniref:Uncharacterized protein n=1 Tax=Halosquirtibacter laminarini TaxID=3374600 RepID=A0AC61NC70_9BACT|nr:hypothetical protein K4L44_10770 [Prolixibacteraceae bacterium]